MALPIAPGPRRTVGAIRLGNLAAEFIDGHVEHRFLTMKETVAEFIQHVEPELAKVKAALHLFYQKKLEDISRELIEDSFRKDADEARLFLQFYLHAFKTIQSEQDMMVVTHLNIQSFLAEHPDARSEDLYLIKPFITKYWNDTYGVLSERFRLIQADLEELHGYLQRQVFLLASVAHINYFSGFGAGTKIRENFEMEYKIFHEKLIVHAVLSEKKYRKIKESYLGERRRVISLVRAHLALEKTKQTERLKQSEGVIRKAIVCFAFLTGSMRIAKDMHKTGFKAGGRRGLHWLFHRKDKTGATDAKILKQEQICKKAVIEPTEAILKELLENIVEVVL